MYDFGVAQFKFEIIFIFFNNYDVEKWVGRYYPSLKMSSELWPEFISWIKY